MIIGNDYSTIIIKEDKTCALDLLNDSCYDVIMNPFNYTENGYTKIVSVLIKSGTKKDINIALVGDLYSDESNCSVLKDNELVVLLNQDVFIINTYNYKLVKYNKLDHLGNNFGVYLVDDGYIVHGEVEILKLDFELNKIWGFSGSDIFVTQSGEFSFLIDNNVIKVYDWNGIYYEIDSNGRLVS